MQAPLAAGSVRAENLEASITAAIPSPYDLRPPVGARRLPLILSSPHSGREYPACFVAASRLDFAALRRSEDSFVDRIFAHAPEFGASLLTARFPRAYVDVNREPYELDPDMFEAPLPDHVRRSPRAADGLGTIARITAPGTAIYRGRLSFREAERRIQSLYMPYHAALQRLLQATRERFGCAILLDCHSMPSSAAPRDARGRRADIVLGDRHASTAAAALLQAVRERLADMGFAVACNHPYAGGAITQRYGRPGDGVHALQIELCRALYMDEGRLCPLDGFFSLRQNMDSLMETLGAFSLHNLSLLSAADRQQAAAACALTN